MRLFCAVAAVLVVALPVRADEDRDFRARQLYELGRKAYNDGDFQTAYDSFKSSYSLSHKPALLYDVASALQQLKRPHDAAETLRSYLRLRPDDGERPQIEERIRALEEEQRLLDIDKQKEASKPPPETPPPPPSHDALIMPSEPLTATAPPPESDAHRRHKRNVIIAATVGSIVVVGLGVGLGLGLGLSGSTEPLTKSTVGPVNGTK